MSTVTNIQDAPKSKQEKLDDFCKGIANGLSREDAYIEAGYSGLNCRANANKFYRQNHAYVTAYISEHIGSKVPTALKVIEQIMMDPNEKGGIRLKAAQDLCDRGGFTAKQRIEISTKDTKDMTTQELEDEIAKLAAENPVLAQLFYPKVNVQE